MVELGKGDAAADNDGASPMPFLAALVVIVLVVIGIGVATLTGGSDRSEGDLVSRAVAGQNDALQRANYVDFRGYTCPSARGTEVDVIARQRDSVTRRGARFVDGVTDIAVDGGHATATVTYHFEKTPGDLITMPMTFAKQDGTWQVCSAGPG